MDKSVKNDIRINLAGVKETMIFNKPYNARMMHVFLLPLQHTDNKEFLEI